MKNYEKWTDDSIIASIRNRDLDAMDFLCQKYKGLVKNKSKMYFMPGADQEDLIQEGMIGLYQAILSYDETKNSSFSAFADIVVSRHILNAIRRSNRKKNGPLNHYISLDSAVGQKTDLESDNGFSILDTLILKRNQNPEELVIDKETYSVITYELGRQLSRFEKSVFELSSRGMDYQEIAKVLDKSPKSIDNALQRIKNKCKKLL